MSQKASLVYVAPNATFHIDAEMQFDDSKIPNQFGIPGLGQCKYIATRSDGTVICELLEQDLQPVGPETLEEWFAAGLTVNGCKSLRELRKR